MNFLFDYLKKPEWGSQHRWRRAIFNTMSRMGLTGVHALPLNRRWVEIHRRRMPLKGWIIAGGIEAGADFRPALFAGGVGEISASVHRMGE